jgi:Lamin Tail Domain
VSTQSLELFSLGAATPAGGELHGSVALQGQAEAGASIRRGINLSAGIDIQASVGGDLGDQLSASLDAGVGARAGVALQAGFPLDLFSEAGLVARLRAQAEVAGYLKARLGLPLSTFRELVRERVPAVMGRLLDIFFEETAIEAGLWARAAFAAEVLGEVRLAGSLLSSPGREAGFTFSARYGAGFGYGTGMDFVANLAVEDPRRLLDRMAEELTALVLSEADALLEDPDTSPGAWPATAIGRVVLPASMRTLTHLGFSLAQTAVGQQRSAATRAVIEAIASQAQEVVLSTLFELAADLLGEHLSAQDVVGALADLDFADRSDAVSALTELRERLADLNDLEPADVEAWLITMLSVVKAAEQVLALGILPAATLPDLQRGLALMWTSGTLANRVAGWLRNPARGAADLFGASPAAVPDNSSTAAYVAGQLSKPVGSGLNLADLVTFLVGQNALQELAERQPAFGEVVTWLETVFGSPAGGLLSDLAAAEELDVDELFESIGDAFAGAVSEQLLPGLLDPIKQRDPDNQAIALVIDEVVVPVLAGLPTVVIPRLPQLADPDVGVRVREALSALVLQSLRRFVMAAVDVLLEHGLNEGEGAVREAAALVDQLDEQAPGFAPLAMVASQAGFGIAVTPQDVVGILELAADSIRAWNQQQRQPLLEAVSEMVSLGLSTEDTRVATLATLTGGDDATAADQLEALLDRVADGAWSMVELIGPRALELLALHFLNQAIAIAEVIYEGAKAIVAAVEQGIAWLAQRAAELLQLVGELAGRVAALLAKALGDIRALATHMTTLIAGVLDDVRDYGASLVEPLLTPFPQFVKDALLGVYHALFDVAKAFITAPFQILSAIAGWAEAALTTGIQAGAVSAQQIRSTVADRINGSFAGTLTFQLKVSLGCVDTPLGRACAEFDAGTVTLPGAEIVRAIAAAVLGDTVFTGTVNAAAADAQQAQGIDAQRKNAQAALDGVLTQQQASQEAQDMVVGAPLSVSIASPEANRVYEQAALLTVRITGANSTFVRSTLGVPPRVEVRVNGRLCTYTPDQWSQDINGIQLSVQIAAAMPEPQRPVQVAAPGTIVRSVEQATAMTGILSGDRNTILLRRPGVSRAAGVDAALFLRGRTGSMIAGAAPSGRLLVDRAAAVSVSGTVKADLDPRQPPASTQAPPLSLAPGPGGTARVGRFGVNSVLVSVSDGSSERAAASVVFLLGSGMPQQPDVTIEAIVYDPPGRDVAAEHVVLRSRSASTVDLRGWTLRDLAGHVYRFPGFTLQPSAEVRVFTGEGSDGPDRLFWGRRAAVWNNRGDSAVLTNASGREVHRYTYRPGRRT